MNNQFRHYTVEELLYVANLNLKDFERREFTDLIQELAKRLRELLHGTVRLK